MYSAKLDLLFIHIAKTGGSSVIEAIQTLDPYVDTGHQILSGYPPRLVQSAKEVCTIVRNPWDRVVSIYCYGRMRNTRYTTGGRGEDYAACRDRSFPELVRTVHARRRMLKLPVAERPHFQYHWTPMVASIHPGDSGCVPRIFRYENMGEVADFLRGYGLQLGHVNASVRNTDYRTYYTDETAQMVGEIYADDVAQFQYTFE